MGLGDKNHKHKKGDGIFDDIRNKVMPIAQEIGKAALPIAVDYGKKKLLGGKCPHCHKEIGCSGALLLAGSGLKKRGRPSKHGGNIGDQILSGISTVAPLLPLLF